MSAKASSTMTWPAFLCWLLAGAVWMITPVSWMTVAYHYLIASKPPIHNWLYRFWLGHALIDVPFSIYLIYLGREAQKRRPLEFASLDKMKELFLECLEVGMLEEEQKMGIRRGQSGRTTIDDADVSDARAMAAREKYCQWFIGRPSVDQVKHDNIYEWCAWAIANKEPFEIEKGSKADEVIEQGISWLESRVKYRFEPGYNEKLKSIRLNLDPVKIEHRPFGYYFVTNGVTLGAHAFLLAHGCRFEKYGKCTYIVRDALPGNAPSKTSSGLPILFLHGLGIGLGQYFAFLRRLVKRKQAFMILIQPHISTQIYDPRYLNPPTKEEHVESFKTLCSRKGYDKVTVVSHSNGTFVHGWLLRGAQELCYRNILTDPVSLCLWYGDVCHSFLHKKPVLAVEYLLEYFVARECGVARSISRLFNWTDMLLREHELPSVEPGRLQVIFAEGDVLIDAKEVLNYLHERGVHDDAILLVPGSQHGAATVTYGTGMKRVLASL